jgi:hypothetical protein
LCFANSDTSEAAREEEAEAEDEVEAGEEPWMSRCHFRSFSYSLLLSTWMYSWVSSVRYVDWIGSFLAAPLPLSACTLNARVMLN